MGAKGILEEISPEKGAYILQIHVDKAFEAPIARLKNPLIRPGRYLYCGSAKGPGGIRARVKRHVKRDKKAHWHVDRLTIAFGVEALSIFENTSECDLVSAVLEHSFASQPYPKFGSSDCEVCCAHLVHLDEGVELEGCGFSVPVLRPGHGTCF
ncbi:GIY-YIG nuclease family protein [Terasakiella sp. SH-1]|uniref:GIY-YIG nuclease family protein n=1 Tax=Terasakiella sp. SH-1 TaxID=2560057 RepID=UPI001073C216|nr:GIY-YIG nuclease family protein [Terasakiella sp. SH-1]